MKMIYKTNIIKNSQYNNIKELYILWEEENLYEGKIQNLC